MDKYPKLDDFDGEAPEGDFLSREKAMLGEEEAAKFGDVEVESEEEFQSNYPALDTADVDETTDGVAAVNLDSAQEEYSVRSETPAANGDRYGFDLAESEFVQEWKVKHQLEIERRDKASSDRQAETRKNAEKAIDDFYTNYNTKKESAIEKVREEAAELIKQRDEGVGSGTTWDRVATLIEKIGTGAVGVKAADKKRFKELIDSLKGDANAPGAAGY